MKVAAESTPGTDGVAPAVRSVGGSRPDSAGVTAAKKVVVDIFKHFDARGDGMFSCAALANVLRVLDTGAAMTDKEINKLLAAIDTMNVGWIHYEAFCECIFGSMVKLKPPLAEGRESKEDMAENCCPDQNDEEDLSLSLPLPNLTAAPSSRASFPDLNPFLSLELARIDGCDRESVQTERVPCEEQDLASSTQRAPDSGRSSRRGSGRSSREDRGSCFGPPSSRQAAVSEITVLPELAKGISQSLAETMATEMTRFRSASSTAPVPPPWGAMASENTAALVSCAQEANDQYRSYMEDGHKVVDPYLVNSSDEESRWGFFAVYDGHGGRQAVDYCEERMHNVLLQELQTQPKEKDVKRALCAAFARVDSELAMLGAWRNGCTATVALVCRTGSTVTLHVGNVGDTRAVLLARDGVRRISTDHRATDLAEAARIAEEGGLVRHGRVGGQLIVSRSIGDHHLKGCGVSCTPEVHTLNVTGKHALVIASDGLWDGVQDADAGDIVDRCMESALSTVGRDSSPQVITEYMRQHSAQLLVDAAKDRGSRDNILVLVLFF